VIERASTEMHIAASFLNGSIFALPWRPCSVVIAQSVPRVSDSGISNDGAG
jgi:hypothetical protein